MPVYTYQVINEDGSEGETFEVVRRMSDPPLRKHPETRRPVRRVYKPVHIAGMFSESANKARTSEKNLERLGFTKYQRSGKGHYEKRVGAGPDLLSADD